MIEHYLLRVEGNYWGNDIDGAATTDCSVQSLAQLEAGWHDTRNEQIESCETAVILLSRVMTPEEIDAARLTLVCRLSAKEFLADRTRRLEHAHVRLAEARAMPVNSPLADWLRAAKPGDWMVYRASGMYDADVIYVCVTEQEPQLPVGVYQSKP